MATKLDTIDWPVRTDRLSLRPLAPDDLPAIWRIRRIEEVSRWMTFAPRDFAAFQRLFLDPDRLARTLVVELDGAIIGDLMLAVEDAWAQTEVAEQARGVQAEIGFGLHPDHVGHGYATEAVRALLRICFVDLGLRRVTANCFADNERSWRLMERIGMRRELHTVRESLHRSGEWLDGYGYALLADEWHP
ncbi:GNAT family N-acetyltransferase [Nocardioides pacificus]